MNPGNILALGAFFGLFMLGILALTMQSMARKNPKRRIKERVAQVAASQNIAQTVHILNDSDELFRRREEHGAFRTWLSRHNVRINAVSGRGGVRLLWASFGFAIVAAILIVRLAPVPIWAIPIIVVGVPVFVWRFVYARLIGRFRSRFLKTFPDTIDLIVRAVRAGIPAVQAISVAGNDAEEPVRSEFRVMGDSLRLGADLKDVLDTAVERIQIADFSFFSVCLLLQRETGGALTETLENLAGIIRTRRDIRLKIRALTGEGRIASQIITAVPFFIMAMFFLTNREYLDMLFYTPAGQRLLWISAGLMVFGTLWINKLANLDTSR
ncbi:type II secretion system F family protein [Burkholderia sp. L27(2015)]|uniref:type II secretion system F family protein n=1 Tax=Burkholderia sp. L27(2015) TaxID=1641858 RepID=UPI00131C60A0|nr:type II secretion system F family protein [Burkholderia sp. L27(2015)]